MNRRASGLTLALRRLLPPAPALIEVDLIAMLFEGIGAIILMAVAAAIIAVQAVLAEQWPSALFCAGIAVISVVRYATVRRFHRAVAPQTLESARRWERQFAYGSYATALALGASNFEALRLGDPVLGILVIGGLFAYAFLVVLRVSVRPRICAASILLAVAPTAAGLPALFDAGTILSRGFAASALITIFSILVAAAGSMIVHSYRLTLGQMLARRDLTHMARQDPLTGMLNRLALREQFDASVGALGDGPLLAVHYLDLDRFKTVNDCNGHRCGDLLLCDVAARLQRCAGPLDHVFRLGGDEFVVLQPGIAGRAPAVALGQIIVDAIAQPFVIDGTTLNVGISIGTAMAPDDGRELDELLASADGALYRAKLDGGGLHHFWAAPPPAPARRRVA